MEPSSLFSVPEEEVVPVGGASGLVTPVTEGMQGGEERPKLRLEDLTAGYVRRVQANVALKAGGMRNWRGGVKRIKLGFV